MVGAGCGGRYSSGMSRKHYETIAADIRIAVLASTTDDFAYGTLKALIARLCNTFSADNSRFDAVRFTAACGIVSRQVREVYGE